MTTTEQTTDCCIKDTSPLTQQCVVIPFLHYQKMMATASAAVCVHKNVAQIRAGAGTGRSLCQEHQCQPGCESDDATLVAQAIDELPAVTHAYELLIQRYYGLLVRTCFGILKSPDEVEDVCQTILIKVFHGLPRFEGRSTFKTWLVTIATNTCFSRYQQIKLETRRYSRLEDHNPDSHVTDSHGLPDVLWQDDLNVMLSGLTNEEKKIIHLRFVSELSLAEIADIMAMGLSATKMRFYRALEKLKQQL